ncbi:MAG: sulfatase-like hydrolase/transferase [Thermoanaerobaculia bacterium]
MTPRIRSAGLGLLAPIMAATLAVSCARGHSQRPDRIPRAENVLVVTVDTLRADRVGAHGSRAGATPHIDALARRGIVFERAFTTAPLTLPAHVSLFSGLLPVHSGVRVNGTDRVPAEVPLLAEQLRAAGFATGAAVGSFVLRSETGIARGFAAYDESFAANAGRKGKWEGERRAEEVVERALGWLDRTGPERFFLWVHLFDPHAPYAPPAPYAERFAGRPYDGEVAYADACLGRLLQGMTERGRVEQTLIVVAGDHGESLGEHGEATHGVFLYDATLRVPLILVPPENAPASRVAAPVSLVDVAPTVREAAGLAPSVSDGTSLLRPSDDRIVLAESNYPAVLLGWSPLRAARSATKKYVEAPRPEFYDLTADPAETRNAFRREDEAMRRLARAMERRRFSAPARAAASSGSDPEVARRLASLGYLTARHPGADLDRIDATRVDPKDRISWWDAIESGIVAQQAGRSEEAARILERLVHDYPEEDAVLLRELAAAQRRSGRIAAAVKTYERILRRFPPIAEDYFGLGVCRHVQGRDDLAARAHEQAVALDAAREDAWINLGQEYLALGALLKAADAFQHAVRLDARSVDALSGLAAVAYEQKDFAVAARRLREALAISPGHPQALANLEEVERAMRRSRDRES